MSSTTLSQTSSTATSTATSSCITVEPGKYGYVPEDACNANYSYNPSFAAAIIFSICFGISLILHVGQAFYFSKWKLCWVIVMGVTWETAAFCLRSVGTRDQQNEVYPYISQVLVLLAPMWVNAFDYMVMGRMIWFFVPDQKIWRIRGNQIAKIFVWFDILSFLTQLVGGVMISPDASNDAMMRGIHIYMGGIGLQEFFIVTFATICIRFHIVMRQHEKSPLGTTFLDGRPRNWRWLLYAVYASLTLITIRIIYRMAEFAKGLDPAKNSLPFHEVYFMVLEALPLFIACLLMNIVHPGMVLKGEGSEFPKGPTRKEKKEMKRIKKEEKKARREQKKAEKQARKNGISLDDIV